MDFSHEQESSSKRLTGITVVILLHAFVGFMVVSGMGKRLVDKIQNPVETKIIEEVKPPPPQDLPPPPPPPEIKSPPPPFIPPPEVVVQTPAQQSPVAVQTSVQPPAAAPVRPTAPAPTGAPPGDAKPAPPARTPAVLSVTECGKPEYPKNSARNEEEGTVLIAFLVGADNKVINAKIERSSGFRELDKAAVAFLSNCKNFKAGTENGKAVESWARVAYEWKIE